MTTRQKTALGLFAIAFLGILVLAMSLSGLDFSQGQAFPFFGDLQLGANNSLTIPISEGLIRFARLIYLLFLVSLPLILAYLVISPKARKQVLTIILALLPIILLVYFIGQAFDNVNKSNKLPENPAVGNGFPGESGINLPPIPQDPGPSENMIVIISVLISIAVTMAILAIIWFYLRRRNRKESTFDRLAEEAQSALDELGSGGNLKNAILHCYFEMSDVLREQLGLRRDQSMTPEEFYLFLTEKGLPAGPVRQLTHLFEDVRYGDIPVGGTQEQQARASLRDIIAACRSGN
jgi:flagellar basal body-associated protein FliL